MRALSERLVGVGIARQFRKDFHIGRGMFKPSCVQMQGSWTISLLLFTGIGDALI